MTNWHKKEETMREAARTALPLNQRHFERAADWARRKGLAVRAFYQGVIGNE